MKITNTTFKEVLIIEPEVHEDTRGFFMETYNKQAFKEFGLPVVIWA
ncbi:dTDP-4-dehydrorhamnose 3,5-epimerase family protein [Paenibacillus oryzae]|nr:dTDP-4-dehydrorhamnose 3,5-epimerase family protein [Paenibacillus oryzae]